VAHHDEAHTKRQLSQNLDSNALHRAKDKWTSAVRKKRAEVASVSGQRILRGADSDSSVGVAWGYINHKRVAQLAIPKQLNDVDHDLYRACYKRGLIDRQGIPVRPKNVEVSESYINNSIYGWYEFGDDMRLHRLYSAFVDQISQRSQPVHLVPENWTKANIRDLVQPGALVFVEKAFYFKTCSETRENQHRRCRTFKRKIRIEFFIDTRDMYGTTSMTVSFSGHKTCAALIQVKSFEEAANGWLLIHCTPIALGVGFLSTM